MANRTLHRTCPAWIGKAAATILTGLALLASPAAFAKPHVPASAQVVGTVVGGRYGWNPFHAGNDMHREARGVFSRRFYLSTTGGRNADGIYAMRFHTGRELREVFKRGARAGRLVSGPMSASAGNVIFRVPRDGWYTVGFDPAAGTYFIRPRVEEKMKIKSFQVNGFVHDREGATEWFDGRRTRPAEKWDEWAPGHEFTRRPDGSWSITLPLSSTGGHEKNGVYQCLFSANHNSDWGYGGIIGQPGRLAAGNGYDSRVGHIGESAVVFRVVKDGEYTITVQPYLCRYTITPSVEYFRGQEFQVNGDVVEDPWNPASPSHRMAQDARGNWTKQLHLTPNGGSLGNGTYTMNFSIDGNWALDSIGFGGAWGRTWHSDPQEWNLLFRVEREGDYLVTLDPAKGTFSFEPGVRPLTNVESLQISGNFPELAMDGSGGWNPTDPGHDMASLDGRRYTKELNLAGGVVYEYKYTANRAGWAWSLVDYPYDGYRRLAPHGNPPALRFECPDSGLYRFSADVESGEYSVNFIRLR
ncbi:MAG: hypothetical protein HGB02_01515 [Chlorobiaceae bacterium]|nr:hypothetical protein [Chlorobiaceae bacterium]